MSSEVVKKRGRPKKVISDSISGENIEPVKKVTVRQKSTKTSAPPAAISRKCSAATPEDASISSATDKNMPEKSEPLTVMAKTSPSARTTSPKEVSTPVPVPTNISTNSSPPKITPASSKILNQVRALSSKSATDSKNPSPSSNTLNFPTQSPAATATASSKAKAFAQINAKQLAPTSLPKASTPKAGPEPLAPSLANALKASSPQQPPKSIPIAALNSSIVSEISSRAGARPSHPPTELPASYKPVARKVTMAIIALPIAIVTSWVLYERLVLGDKRGNLVKPKTAMVENSLPTRKRGGEVVEKDD